MDRTEKDDARVDRLPGDEHVVAPHEEAQDGDADGREGDELVAEDRLARERGHELADDAHGGQDHDVDGGVRVEPEQVLEEDRIAAELRIEDPDVKRALGRDEKDGDRDDRRPEDLDDARRVMAPHEERQPEPREARRAHAVDRDDEVQARENRREAGDEDADAHRENGGVHVVRRERRVERPSRVDAAVQERPQREGAADRVEVPREQVDAREREVLRADHERDQEVSEDGRDPGNQEEEDHQHAVHREQAVVDVRLEEVAFRRRELHADEHRHEAAEREEDADRDEIEKRDSLVVSRQEPRLQAVGGIEVMRARAAVGVRRPGRGSCGGGRGHFRASAVVADAALSDLT